MTDNVPGLRAALERATRVVVETDHIYREVGKIVAVDVERVEFTPDHVRAALATPSSEPSVEPGLNVEQLARALASVDFEADPDDNDRRFASKVAAEYVRLAAHHPSGNDSDLP